MTTQQMKSKIDTKQLILNVLKKDKAILSKNKQTVSQQDRSLRRTISVDQIKSTKWKLKQNLFNWNNRDFAMFLLQCYQIKNVSRQPKWQPSLVGITTYVPRIRDAVSKIVGFCDNAVLRDYLQYYFKQWQRINSLKYGQRFSLGQMLYDNAITDFAKSYDYKSQIDKYIKVYGLSQITMQKLQIQYEKGIEYLVCQFGVLSAANYLCVKMNKQPAQAVKQSVKSIVDIYRNDLQKYEKAKQATFNYSPYPKKFPIKNYVVIFEAIKKRTNDQWYGQIVFKDSEKWIFEVQNEQKGERNCQEK